ncbi:AsmA family protein [Niveispirillum sp. KHB5.9]|uniref:AsmA family protein n=1 Tax=Niveispirillum sp. KHB5.9 TaxID=3400269 RepID=UPI003A8BB210
MRRRTVFYWGAGIVAGTLLALVLAVILFDWSRLAPWLGSRLSDETGREVTVADLDIDWSWHPRILVTGLRVANADWAGDQPLADIETLDVTLSIPALFRGQVELPRIVVAKPQLRLAQDKQGHANWDFTAGKVAGAAAPDNRREMPLIGILSITDGTLEYHDQRKGIDFNSRLSSIAAQGGSGREQVRIEGDGTVEGKPFKLSLTGGSLLALRAGDEPYGLKLEATAGGTRFTLDGTMKDPIKLDGADMALTLKGPDLAEIFPIFGIPTPTTAAYDLRGRLRRGEGLWRVDDLKGKVGQSDLGGFLSIDPREEIPLIRAELVSKQLRLVDLGGLIGLDPGKADPSAGVAAPDRVLPAVPVKLERLRAADMDIQFTGANVEAPGLPLRELGFHLKLTKGRLVLDPLRFQADIGQVVGTIILDGAKDLPVGEFNLGIRNVGLKPFFKNTGFADQTDGTMAGRLNLKGSGRSVAEILGNADGEVMLVMENGRISHLLVEVAGLDAAEAIGRLIGGDEPIAVRCMVADFGVTKGDMRSRTLVMDTTDTNIGGRLQLDLSKERLDGRLRPKPKDFSPLTARVPILIGGTLKNPQVGVDGGRLAGKGAAAVALGALLTPLAAIIPFLDAGGGEDSPCRTLVGQAWKEQVKKPPPPPKPAKGK